MFVVNIKYKKLILLLVLVLSFSSIIYAVGTEFNAVNTMAKESVDVPIIMYHHFLKEQARWGKYVISPDDFEKDLIYLEEHGYTTVLMQDLINYVYSNIPLPEKPIVITFDDGYLSNYAYIYPILQKHNAKAVISIVGVYTDLFTENPDDKINYSHLNWDQVKELVDSPNVEIQNHSYDMHKVSPRRGSSRKKGESDKDYINALDKDILYFQNLIEEHTGYRPTTYTYPLGETCKGSEEILRNMGFVSTLTCYEGVNVITKDPESLFELKRYNRPAGINRDKFFGQFEK